MKTTIALLFAVSTLFAQAIFASDGSDHTNVHRNDVSAQQQNVFVAQDGSERSLTRRAA